MANIENKIVQSKNLKRLNLLEMVEKPLFIETIQGGRRKAMISRVDIGPVGYDENTGRPIRDVIFLELLERIDENTVARYIVRADYVQLCEGVLSFSKNATTIIYKEDEPNPIHEYVYRDIERRLSKAGL